MDADEFKELLEQFRSKSKHHFFKVESTLSPQEICVLFKQSNRLRLAGDELFNHMRKRYNQLVRTKRYRALLKLLGKAEATPDEKQSYAQQLEDMQAEYGVTMACFLETMQGLQVKYQVDGAFAFSKAMDIWKDIESCLYQIDATLEQSNHDMFPALTAAQINKGIILTAKDGTLQFKYDSMVFGAKIKDNFEQEEINAVIHYLTNHSQVDQDAIKIFKSTGTCINTYRPCYVSLVPQIIRDKRRLYISLYLEGLSKNQLAKMHARRPIADQVRFSKLKLQPELMMGHASHAPFHGLCFYLGC